MGQGLSLTFRTRPARGRALFLPGKMEEQRTALKKLKIADLQQRLKDRGLAPFGPKGELVERLLAEDFKQAAPQTNDGDPIFGEIFGPGGGKIDVDKKDKKDKKDGKDKKEKGEKKEKKEHKENKENKERKDQKEKD